MMSVIIAALALAAAPPGVSPEVVRDLHRHYAAPGPFTMPPRIAEAAERLRDDDPATRRRASAYLLAVVRQALADERSGTRWPLGSAEENEARLPRPALVRAAVAQHAAGAGLMPETLPLIHLLLDGEPHSRVLEELVPLWQADNDLRRPLALRVAGAGHRDSRHLIEALKQLTQERAALPDAVLAPLALHHRADVREAARTLGKALGRPALPAFDPLRAFAAPAIQALLKRVGEELPDLPPPGAKLAVLTLSMPRAGGEQAVEAARGWVVSREEGRLVMLAGVQRVVNRDWLEFPAIGRPAPVLLDLTPGDEVRRLEREAARENQPEASPTYRLMLAWWLGRTGQPALAARLLFPLLARHPQDGDVLTALRHDVAVELGQRMFEAYANARDYPEALRLARRIAHYPGSPFSEEAACLAAELPRRAEDFKSLRLPTPAAWKALRNGLTREEQIDFLCRRLRLLDPGPMQDWAGSPQYADPAKRHPPYVRGSGWYHGSFFGLAATPAEKGRTPVINPYRELLEGVKVTLADVPHLARHMREEWTLVSIGRQPVGKIGQALPSLELTTRSALAALINGLARNEVCVLGGELSFTHWGRLRHGRLPEAEVLRRIEAAVVWAAKHAGMSARQLDWHWLEKDLAAGKGWHDIHERFDRVSDEPSARTLLHALLLDGRTRADERAHVLRRLADLAPRHARRIAPHLLSSPSVAMRVEAALLCLPTAHADAARRVLGQYLHDAGRGEAGTAGWVSGSWVRQAVGDLANDGTPESVRAALRVFEGVALRKTNNIGDRGEAMRLLALAGAKEPYTFYLKLLDETKKADERVQITEEVAWAFGKDDPEVQAIMKKHRTPAARAGHVEKWLRGRAGEPAGVLPGVSHRR